MLIMKEVQFNSTSIPTLISEKMRNLTYIHPTYADKILETIFGGTSRILGRMKNTSDMICLEFKNPKTDEFIAAATISYSNDDYDDMSKGYWNYTWTFNEDDIDSDAVIIDFASEYKNLVSDYVSYAINRYHVNESILKRYIDIHTVCHSLDLIMSILRSWLVLNVSNEGIRLVLPGVFHAFAMIDSGETIIGIEPSGEMKILVKGDNAIQQ